MGQQAVDNLPNEASIGTQVLCPLDQSLGTLSKVWMHLGETTREPELLSG